MERRVVVDSMSLSKAEKERILKALEEDREFRYALMGLLGFKEILDRITKLEEGFSKLLERQQRLEERQQKLEERFARLEERQQRLEERQQKLEERFAELEERFAKLEERFAKLEERVVRLEERQQKLEERFLRLEERVTRLEEEMRETRRVVITIAHRFGVITEVGFREAMKYVISDIFGVAKVEKWVYRDDEGLVYGYPSVVEVDVLVRDKEHVLIEVKSRVSKGDVSEIHRIGQLYEKVVKVKPKLVIIGGFIDKDAEFLASRLGVEIKPIFRE
ncbi:MAG TPA: DUF3782 domain-containing protein [Acidilobales archaeon]|nr:DUF3782 domain-containing protein [Acidilobales archaeon]